MIEIAAAGSTTGVRLLVGVVAVLLGCDGGEADAIQRPSPERPADPDEPVPPVVAPGDAEVTVTRSAIAVDGVEVATLDRGMVASADLRGQLIDPVFEPLMDAADARKKRDALAGGSWTGELAIVGDPDVPCATIVGVLSTAYVEFRHYTLRSRSGATAGIDLHPARMGRGRHENAIEVALHTDAVTIRGRQGLLPAIGADDHRVAAAIRAEARDTALLRCDGDIRFDDLVRAVNLLRDADVPHVTMMIGQEELVPQSVLARIDEDEAVTEDDPIDDEPGQRPDVLRKLPIVEGAIDPAAVGPIASAAAGDLRGCYAAQLLRTPDVGGSLDIELAIARSGKVASATVVASTFTDAKFHACFVQQAKRWRFPASKGARIVQGFVLEP